MHEVVDVGTWVSTQNIRDPSTAVRPAHETAHAVARKVTFQLQQPQRGGLLVTRRFGAFTLREWARVGLKGTEMGKGTASSRLIHNKEMVTRTGHRIMPRCNTLNTTCANVYVIGFEE